MSVITPTVMIIDDDLHLLSGLKRHLRKQFTVHTFSEPSEALVPENLANVGVVLADMRMPGMDGITLLQKVASHDPLIQRMMLTGDADQSTAVAALNTGGVCRFFNKPCAPDDLIAGLKDGLRRYELEHAEKELLEKTLSGSIKMLVDILSMTQPEAFGAASRLRKSARAMAQALDLRPVWAVEIAAMLLPLGWVSIPPAVQARYHNGEALTPQELEMIANIPGIGADLIGHIPRLQAVADILRYSARAFDGYGASDHEPVGETLPKGARLLKIIHDLDCVADGQTITESHVQRLVQRGARYDQALLAEIETHMLQQQGHTGPTQAREYMIKDLMTGLELLSDLKTADGKLILAAGKELTPAHVSRIKNFARMTRLQEPVLCQPGGTMVY